ncbi:hypothetical protein ACFLWN_00070 [Chloroflexota bacterium]
MVTRVKERKAVVRQEQVSPEGCVHYWIIETSHGPTSEGVCKICGEKKEFSNLMFEPAPPTTWQGKNPLALPEMQKVRVVEDGSKS